MALRKPDGDADIRGSGRFDSRPGQFLALALPPGRLPGHPVFDGLDHVGFDICSVRGRVLDHAVANGKFEKVELPDGRLHACAVGIQDLDSIASLKGIKVFFRERFETRLVFEKHVDHLSVVNVHCIVFFRVIRDEPVERPQRHRGAFDDVGEHAAPLRILVVE